MTLTIKPFKAIRYNENLGNEIDKLVSPPYDVYETDDETDKKLKSDKRNFSYIIKPLGDDATRYENSRKKLIELLEKNVLVKDNDSAIYIYEQNFKGKKILGFISAIKLEEYESGVIMRHEMTKTKPVNDRMNLLSKLQINTALIYTVFDDERNKISGILSLETIDSPLFSFVDDNGVKNKVWKIKDEKFIETVTLEMQNKKLYIADGHHRYHTALTYAKNFDPTLKKDISTNYVLSYIVPKDNASIYPYNRVIYNISDELFGKMLETATRSFEVLEKSKKVPYTPRKEHIIVMYYKEKVYELFPKNVPKDVIGCLDVSILQNTILANLGFTIEKLKGGDEIEYIKGEVSPSKIRKIVNAKNNSVGFCLYPVSADELKAVADANMKDASIVMPPKSTYFYPKPCSGIVSYKF